LSTLAFLLCFVFSMVRKSQFNHLLQQASNPWTFGSCSIQVTNNFKRAKISGGNFSFPVPRRKKIWKWMT
jgi:hypothetical protein